MGQPLEIDKSQSPEVAAPDVNSRFMAEYGNQIFKIYGQRICGAPDGPPN